MSKYKISGTHRYRCEISDINAIFLPAWAPIGVFQVFLLS